MADGEITISELELSEELLADMVIPVETSTDTKSATLAQLRSWLGTSLPIGSIFVSVGKIDDARFTLLDGKTLSATGTYAEFYLKAVEQVQAGKWKSCTEEEFNQDISNYGQCGKFVISNDYVRIPKLTRFIGATNNIAEVGSTYGESLPNIRGRLRYEKNGYGSAIEASGALSCEQGSGNAESGGSSGSGKNATIILNANESSSTYQDNAKVQPDHTKYFYYMVISTAGQTEPIEIDINQVYEDMELKANKNLSNVDANIDYVVESYKSGTSGYRVWKSGYCEQWGKVNNNSTTTTISLLKTFENANYNITGSLLNGTTSASYEHFNINNITASSFRFTSYDNYGLLWRASGYLASGQY